MKRERHEDPPGGVVLWKPIGLTSRQAVDVAQGRLGQRRLGHCGTLDPLAAGILVLVGGQSRKFQELLVEHPKEYRARIYLGIISESEDAEGPLRCPLPRSFPPDIADIENALDRFRGGYWQRPPRRSAVHIQGERAHVRARRGESAEPAPRLVAIHEVELVRWKAPLLEIRVTCGAGTYLRSLARDLGEALGTGAFLSGLRRTAASGFGEEDAVPLFALRPEHWRSPEQLLVGLPKVEIERDVARRLAQGQRVPIHDRHLLRAPEKRDRKLVAWSEGHVAGVVEIRAGNLYPRRWLVADAAG